MGTLKVRGQTLGQGETELDAACRERHMKCDTADQLQLFDPIQVVAHQMYLQVGSRSGNDERRLTVRERRKVRDEEMGG